MSYPSGSVLEFLVYIRNKQKPFCNVIQPSSALIFNINKNMMNLSKKKTLKKNFPHQCNITRVEFDQIHAFKYTRTLGFDSFGVP